MSTLTEGEPAGRGDAQGGSQEEASARGKHSPVPQAGPDACSYRGLVQASNPGLLPLAHRGEGGQAGRSHTA